MSAGDLATIHDLSRRGDHTVIAVAFDLGDARLRELHDQARLAGAERCHVIDVREEFARGYVLPAIHRGTALTEELAGALAASCVEKKLQQVAELEGDAQAKAPAFVSISGAVPVMPVAIDRGADVEVTFEAGTRSPSVAFRCPCSS